MTVETDIKEEVEEALQELRMRMKGDLDQELYDDKFLFLRFLKARDFDVNNAEAMLRKHLIWREKVDIKNIMNVKHPEVSKYFINVTLGYDKEGYVVRYAPIGAMDFIGLLNSWTPDEFTKTILNASETDTLNLKNQSKKHGRNIDKCVYIYDGENASFATISSKKVLYSAIYYLHIFMNNYPERLKAGYLINAPVYFSILVAVMKRTLPKTIMDKIHIYNDDSYKEELLKIIDADVLPVFLGGNRTDPDGNPRCLELIPQAEVVPQSYYIQRDKRTLAKAKGVKKITLSRASFHEVAVDVKEAGSYLEWEFETKCRDIGFGVFYNEMVDGEEKITELVAIQRIDTEEYPEVGTLQCDHPGTYVILFDNTYSWVRAKEIYYRAKVVTPKEHEAQIAK